MANISNKPTRRLAYSITVFKVLETLRLLSRVSASAIRATSWFTTGLKYGEKTLISKSIVCFSWAFDNHLRNKKNLHRYIHEWLLRQSIWRQSLFQGHGLAKGTQGPPIPGDYWKSHLHSRSIYRSAKRSSSWEWGNWIKGEWDHCMRSSKSLRRVGPSCLGCQVLSQPTFKRYQVSHAWCATTEGAVHGFFLQDYG